MPQKKIEKLQRLAQLDVDAIGTYDAAMKRISYPVVLEKLGEFRADHVKHVERLNGLLRNLGAEAVEVKPDLKGRVLKGFTAAQSMMGTEGALVAMIGNEELTTHTYHAALKVDWTAEERAVIELHYADERRHLEWIKQAAIRREWAHEAAAHP
ncbi:MAG: ferritin-like domain-containing protein [Myxococcaceae bacterium]|nr:ferritin-like domain-containing protein [Myxococcaceae bacterium]